MHLAIEAVGNKYGGGATVLCDFLSAVVADERIERVTVFSSPRASRRFDMPRSPKIHEVRLSLAEGSYVARTAWYERGLELACHRVGADVVVCMNGMGRTKRIPYVTLIQQSLPFSEEALATLSLGRRLQMRVVRDMMGRSCRNASRIITQTPTMALWVAMAFGLREEKVEPITPTTQAELDSKLPEPVRKRIQRVPRGKRVLYVGTASPYKQLSVLVAAFARLREHQLKPVLSMVGPEPPADGNPPGIEYLGFIPYEQIGAVYPAFDLLILPSLVESCPMPLLEAMSIGLPVLAADRPYAHDVGGEAIAYFNPLESLELAEEVGFLLDDDIRRSGIGYAGREQYHALKLSVPYKRMVDVVVKSGRRTG